MGVGAQARLLAGEGVGADPQRVDRHRQERHGDAFARRQQDVHLAGGSVRRDLVGEVDELVGGVAHRGDDHDDVVPRVLRVDYSLCDAFDAGRVRNGRAAELLHD